MNKDENFVAEEVTENVETQTTEEIVEEAGQVNEPAIPTEKTYTQSEVNQMMGKRLARNEAKIRKEYEPLMNVLRAGTGKDNVSEITDSFSEYYRSKGVQMPTQPSYSDKDIEVLARAEAEDVISMGFDEVIEETERLANIGKDMSAREKALFKNLAEYRQSTERIQELAKIGVTEDVYNSKEFRDFASKFSSNTTVTDIYNIYNKLQSRKEVQPMGSMKNTTVESGVKDFYSRDEALKFTKADFDKNPELYKAVEKSMLKW